MGPGMVKTLSNPLCLLLQFTLFPTSETILSINKATFWPCEILQDTVFPVSNVEKMETGGHWRGTWFAWLQHHKPIAAGHGQRQTQNYCCVWCISIAAWEAEVCMCVWILVLRSFLGWHRSGKLQQLDFKKSVTRSKFGFKFLFSKLHCSLRVSLYLLTSSWQNNQKLADIVISCVSSFIFLYGQDHLCVSVTFCCGTWKPFMPLSHQCSSQRGCSWSLDNFLCLPYSNPLFLSVLGTGQSLWKKVLD